MIARGGSVLGWVSALACLVLLAVAGNAGVTAIKNRSRAHSTAATVGVEHWLCLDKRLHQLVPAGSQVWITNTDGKAVWSLEEISFPDLEVAQSPAPGRYEISEIPATGPRQPGDCHDLRLTVRRIP